MCQTPAVRLVLIGRPGCHLCDDARVIVERVCADTGATWSELSVEDDPVLMDRYAEQIPVLLLDDRPFDFWRIDEARLRGALGHPTP